MANYSLKDMEFIKILANSDSSILEKGMNVSTRERLNSQIGPILCEYYLENTMGTKTRWTEEFKKFGINEGDGKAAIACARRLGVMIL